MPAQAVPHEDDPPSNGWPQPGEVTVWEARAFEHEAPLSAFRHILGTDEQLRLDRLHFARDRHEFLVAHVMLRRVLADLLDVPAGSLEFRANQYGKPYLIQAGVPASLQFNLSHSAGVTLLAVSDGIALGIDIERWNHDISPLELAPDCFSPRERAELAGLPEGDRFAGFFSCWSRKEAYIKATGLGVSAGLDYFDVSVAPERPAGLIADRRHPGAADRWAFHDLAVDGPWSACLVSEGALRTIHRREFQLASDATAGGL